MTVSDVLLDQELRVSLVRTQVTEEVLLRLPLLVYSNVLLQEKSAFEDFAAVQASVLVFWMVLLPMLVEVYEIPPVDIADVAGELQVRLVLDDVVLEGEVALEGQLAVHARVAGLRVLVLCLEVLFQRYC